MGNAVIEPDVLNIVWTPGREKTPWEIECIEQANRVFSSVVVHDGTGCDVPEGWHKRPNGPADLIRWEIIAAPDTLYADVDVYWKKRPVMNKCFMCAQLKTHKPSEAVLWSGDGGRVGAFIHSIFLKCTRSVHPSKYIGKVLGKANVNWRFLKAGENFLHDQLL